MATERSVYRKLRALGIHSPSDIHSHFPALVLKLEEEKIRRYDVDKRGILREAESSKWVVNLRKYCEDLGMDVSEEFGGEGNLTSEARVNILDKLLLLALEEEYLDLEGDGKLNIATEPAAEASREELDEVVVQANRLLEQLGIPMLDEDATVEEIRSAVIFLLSLNASGVEDLKRQKTAGARLYIPLEEVPCGIRSKDPLVIKAARILRTLHSNELCKLQAEIVWLSERFQQLTANPRTNSNA